MSQMGPGAGAWRSPPVYTQGWTLDDVSWELFSPGAVDPTMLAAIKAAAMVEYNAPDHVAYLKRVFGNQAGRSTYLDRAMGRGRAPAWRRPGPLGGNGRSEFLLSEAFARFRRRAMYPPISPTISTRPCVVPAGAK